MSIDDILQGRIQSNDSTPRRRENEKSEGSQRSSDLYQSVTQDQHERRLQDIRLKINSGYYERHDVIEKVADAIYHHLRK